MNSEKRDVEYSKGLVIQNVDPDLAKELETLSEKKRRPLDSQDLVRFYLGEIGTGGDKLYDREDGYKFEEIMNFTYHQMEQYHRWVQWLFPTKEQSYFQPDVPILNNDVIKQFREDPELQRRTKWAFLKVLDFYGFELKDVGDEEHIVLQEAGFHHEHPDWAIRHFNHNYLRLTRVLTALRYFGHDEWSVKFKEALFKHANHDTESRMFWEQAATGQLF